MLGWARTGGLSQVLSPLQRDCHNYIKMLLQLNSTHLYTCGTCAFSPACAYIVSMGSGDRVQGSLWGCGSSSAIGALEWGSWVLGWVLAVLPGHSSVLLQNVQRFSLERDMSGKVLLEDGKGRCPFDPEYRSTAVMVGKARRPGTLALSAAGLNWGQASMDPSGGAELCRVACAGSQQECLFGRRRALRRDCQQLPGQ